MSTKKGTATHSYLQRTRQMMEPGKVYDLEPNGKVTESKAPPAWVDAWVCRRVSDFPPGRIPFGAAYDSCPGCGDAIAYNPKRADTCSAPRWCMQCLGITPQPMPPLH